MPAEAQLGRVFFDVVELVRLDLLVCRGAASICGLGVVPLAGAQVVRPLTQANRAEERLLIGIIRLGSDNRLLMMAQFSERRFHQRPVDRCARADARADSSQSPIRSGI